VYATRYSSQEEQDGRGILHVLRGGEVHTGFRCRKLKERDHLENPDVDRTYIIKIELKCKRVGSAWTEFIELGLEKNSLAVVYVVMKFEFQNVSGIYRFYVRNY